MNAQTAIKPPDLAKLREPFPDHQISKLPKETKAQADQRKADQAKGNWPARCGVCGGLHHKNAVHLDYVGHAALTDRLLDTDPNWKWEPVAFGPDGLPAFDRNGGLWIRLTVLGMTRLGYGDAEGKTGGNAIKEAIGDALRNAAMRFGAALDLWHKGDLHLEEDEGAHDGKEMPDAEWTRLVQLVEATSSDTGKMLKHYKVDNLRLLDHGQYAEAVEALNKKLAKMAKDQTDSTALAKELQDVSF